MTKVAEGTFEDVLKELLKRNGTVCPICESIEKEKVDAAIKAGVPKSKIGQALQIIGIIDPTISIKSASGRISTHINHMNGNTK